MSRTTPSHVYFFVAPVEGSFAEEQSVNSGNFCIAAIIRIRPNSPVVAANASEFNFTASHEIGHSFNLGNCSAQCASVSVNGWCTKRWTRLLRHREGSGTVLPNSLAFAITKPNAYSEHSNRMPTRRPLLEFYEQHLRYGPRNWYVRWRT